MLQRHLSVRPEEGVEIEGFFEYAKEPVRILPGIEKTVAGMRARADDSTRGARKFAGAWRRHARSGAPVAERSLASPRREP